MESGKKMKKEVNTIEFESFEEFMEFVKMAEYIKSCILDGEPEICLTKSQLHEACDDAWQVWSTNALPTRANKMAVAHFIRVLTGKLFGDDKTEKEEN